MSKSTQRVRDMVRRIDAKTLQNNTQRVFVAMMNSDQEWVPRSAIRVKSATARIRDLRKEEYGGFTVECKTARELERKSSTGRQTFYRISPSSLTMTRARTILEGVVNAG